jgi:carbamoyltransferase
MNDAPDLLSDLRDVPVGSYAGLSYSGMHDSALAVVAPDGEPVFAASLERLSRAKQDGRWPQALLAAVPWSRIAGLAVSVSRELSGDEPAPSPIHPLRRRATRPRRASHGAAFFDALARLPIAPVHVPHHLSHAASAHWASGFERSLCLVYDGGMSNETCFGGLYAGHEGRPLATLDHFENHLHANVTQLYSAVTAALGFTPQKHEGKITGLAGYGQPGDDCRAVLLRAWLESDELEGMFSWRHLYGEAEPAELVVDGSRMAHFRRLLEPFEREDVAATLQQLTEEHVRALVDAIRKLHPDEQGLCLAGGLFANVKVNQCVASAGFRDFFVAPPMTDDGTALGAAWQLLAMQRGHLRVASAPVSMYLGPQSSSTSARSTVADLKLKVTTPAAPAKRIAALLARGRTVGVYQGRSEFGPRALGNRSILAPADDGINDTLNRRLSRTEFMPFAPIVREEDAGACFDLDPNVLLACRYMTVTVPCLSAMRERCPGVVHVDGTARPQLVAAAHNPLIHAVLGEYKRLTGRPALVNTSFNVHEEPIVCSVEDALRGFFESGLDDLYVEGVGLVRREDNPGAELYFVRAKCERQGGRIRELARGLRDSVPHAGGSGALFVAGKSLQPYLVTGFHAPEPWGAWSCGRHARMVLPVAAPGEGRHELHLRMNVRIFPDLLPLAPVLSVVVDGELAGLVLFRHNAPLAHDLDFYVPSQAEHCDVRFELTHSASPAEGSGGNDLRELGFGLSGFGISVSAASASESTSRPTPPRIWGGGVDGRAGERHASDSAQPEAPGSADPFRPGPNPGRIARPARHAP